MRCLFRELAAVDVTNLEVTGRQITPGEERTLEGYCGTEEVGYSWSEVECLETSSVPVQRRLGTHGLPGVKLQWSYVLDHAGQLGHCAFRHRRMRVAFADEEAKAPFVRIWRDVYSVEPVFDSVEASD